MFKIIPKIKVEADYFKASITSFMEAADDESFCKLGKLFI